MRLPYLAAERDTLSIGKRLPSRIRFFSSRKIVYAYAEGNPVNLVDPLGLQSSFGGFSYSPAQAQGLAMQQAVSQAQSQSIPLQSLLPNTTISVNVPTGFSVGRLSVIAAFKYKSTPSGTSCSIGGGLGNVGANVVPRVGANLFQSSYGDTSGWGLTSSGTFVIPLTPFGYTLSQTNFLNGATSTSSGFQTVGGTSTFSFTYGYTWKW